jgi:hypothetical protein
MKTLLLTCLLLTSCSSIVERKIEILQEPADDVEFYFESVYELDW